MAAKTLVDLAPSPEILSPPLRNTITKNSIERIGVNPQGVGVLVVYLKSCYNSLSLSSSAFAAAFSASSKTNVFNDSTSLEPDHLHHLLKK